MVEAAYGPEITAMQDKLKGLAQQKKAIEDEIIELSECLTAEGMPGLSGPLVDKEGFPREDIDIP